MQSTRKHIINAFKRRYCQTTGVVSSVHLHSRYMKISNSGTFCWGEKKKKKPPKLLRCNIQVNALVRLSNDQTPVCLQSSQNALTYHTELQNSNSDKNGHRDRRSHGSLASVSQASADGRHVFQRPSGRGSQKRQ